MPKSTTMWKQKKPLIEINEEIRKHEKSRHHRAKALPRFTHFQLYDIYTKNNGACAFCGIQTTLTYQFEIGGAHYMFDIPLSKGGSVTPDNLILVCTRHKKQYNPHKPQRERIPDIDSFADMIEHLFKAVKRGDSEEKIRSAIKYEINTILEEIAIHGHYIVYNEDRPTKFRTPKKQNSVADDIERVAKGEDAKSDIVDGIKTIHVLGEYKC